MFFIRTDGNAKTGAGHIMRCLTIAEEIKKLDKVLFLCADEESAALVQSKGFESQVLGEEPFSAAELAKVSRILQTSGEENRFLIDSYLVTSAYMEEVSRICRVAYMDDMGRQAFPADVIINYNMYAAKERYEELYRHSNKKPLCLLGSSYAPVRKQFLNKDYKIRGNATTLLLTTGGGDADNLAGEILSELLAHVGTKELYVHVVSGAFNPHYESLQNMAKKAGNVAVHKNVQDMADLMSSCDVAVTAGGSTIYELCVLGIPFVCFSYAKNQDEAVSYVAKEKIAGSAGSMVAETGDLRKPVINKIVELIAELAAREELRMTYHKRERDLVDGLGAERLAKVLCGDIWN